MIRHERANEPQEIDLPIPSEGEGLWASDAIAELLRALDIPYIALTPGSSFRGLHDSLVNRLGNRRPQMLLCLHEESAVGIAQGWAKVTDRAMMSIVHANVGLMHATMAVHNAWCDRVPLLLLGSNGPMDAALRRPSVDWIHTTRDQGALIRANIKWDDQPSSVAATYEAILRARRIAETAPCGPTYVCFDVALQETKIDALPPLPDVARFARPEPVGPTQDQAMTILRHLHSAQRPLILMGRGNRSEADWQQRIALVEKLGALVVTSSRQPAVFPSDHPLAGGPPGRSASRPIADLIRQADVVLSLEWYDLGGTLKVAWSGGTVGQTIIEVSTDQYIHNGEIMDYQILPPADLKIMGQTDPTIAALLGAMEHAPARTIPAWQRHVKAAVAGVRSYRPEEPITVPFVVGKLQEALGGRPSCLIRQTISWPAHLWPVQHPLDMLGGDTGGGIGSGPGVSVGAALALKGTGRLPVAVFGDGDFIMGHTAIWTAVRYQIPLLIIVANNYTFYNDELHQEHVSKERGRPLENHKIGIEMHGPKIDVAMMARAQGAIGLGPVNRQADLAGVLEEAVRAVSEGQTVVVDVSIEPGYDRETSQTVVAAPQGKA